jgi:hypothetical protein
MACRMDGWMDGWGGVDKKHFFIIFYPHTNYPDASTYLPTYLVATRVRWVLEIARNNPPPQGIMIMKKKSNTQFLSITMGLKKSNTQLLYNWSSQIFL